MSEGAWTALVLTLQVATMSTVLTFVPATWLGYVLARRDFRGKRLVSALVGLPLVLPPTAVGLLLLQLFASDGPLGVETLGVDLGVLLTWRGAVLAAAVMSMPLVVRTAEVTFRGIDPRLESMAATLGHDRWSVWRRFLLPLAARGLAAGAVLGFTRAVGEFGATVTLAGNIPGRTQTLASAIFSAQQLNDRGEAAVLLAIAVVLGVGAIVAAETLAQREDG
jgi:molybdate transport system permease protein